MTVSSPPRQEDDDRRLSTYGQWYRKWHALLIKVFGGRCNHCGSTEDLEFAHLSETGLCGMGRGSYNRIKDIVDHPDSYVLLCYSCHAAFDGRNEKV